MAPKVEQLDLAEAEKIAKEKIVDEFLPFHKLLTYADAIDWTLMALGTLGSIVHGMAPQVGYLLLGKALDAFGKNMDNIDEMVKAIKKVVPFLWYMAFATFPAGILEIGCWMYTSERQLTRIRLAYLRAILNQDIATFDTDLTTGKIINGISSHMSIIQDAIGEKLGHFLASFSTFLSGLLIAAICCWQVALMTLLVAPTVLVIGGTYTKKMNTISADKLVYLSRATSMVEQTVSQIKTVFAFVGENQAIKEFTDCLDKLLLMSKGEALIKGVGTGMFQTVTFGTWALIIWIGAVAVTSNKSSGGDVIAAVMSILFGAIALTYAAPDLQIFNEAKAAGKDVFQVIRKKPVISYETKGKKTLGNIEGNLEIHNVYFAYPSRQEKLVLRDFSLSVPAGKTVALVGTSGCGKSTIISLVSRFYDPAKGEILIDNHNIKDLDLKFLRKNIGAVSQEPTLFSGTIKDNIRVGNMDGDDEQINNAAKMANADTFITNLPNQYLTEVGERGVQLSGGQKQRIAIARAILKNPPVLLLDEATSALDSESEKLVQDALDKAMLGRTVVVIAHRLSTIVNADIIAVVENGQVTETGTHSHLLKNCRFYNNLFSIQNFKPVLDVPELKSNEKKTPARDTEQCEEPVSNKKFGSSEQAEEESKRKAMIFFRIWFGLTKKDLFKTVIGSFAAAVSGISKPVFGYAIITIGVAYYKPDARSHVAKYSVIFTLIGLVSLFSHTVQHYIFGVIGEKAMKNLRQALYSGVLRNEVAWFEKSENNAGLLTSRVISDTLMVKTVVSDRLSVIVQCISSILIATIVSMVVDWRMGLVAWAVMPCHFIGGLVQAKSAKGFSKDSASTHHEIVSLVSESAANIRTIASFCHEEEIIKKARISLDSPLRQSRKHSIKYGVIQGISLCLWNITHGVALWYTTILVERRQSTFKDALRSYQIFSLTVPSITELWTLIPTVISAISVLTPAFQTLDRKTEIEPDSPKETTQDRIEGTIEFRNVTFNYPLRPEVSVLRNFSLKTVPGSKVALVGPSGAGKSSVIALILRFYDPTKGEILIDGINLALYNLRSLRAQIGLVQQEPLLFSSSIRDNICYGNEGAFEDEIIEAAKKARIHEFISNLPQGYKTRVGEKGSQLSGGQKQRIAIARMILKRPAIILLDEATSALDAESERSVVRALEFMDGGGVTRITVAHRLSTVVDSDSIVVMEKGEVVEMGSHGELVAAAGGVYSRLFRLQSGRES